MGICKDSDAEIPDTVIYWAHRIGVPYVDKTTKKSCKSVIVCFSTFRHRWTVYRAKTNMKCPVKVKTDLTKKLHNLLVSANQYVSNDVNCRLKIKWEDESISDTYFYSLAELKIHVNADEWKLKSSLFYFEHYEQSLSSW